MALRDASPGLAEVIGTSHAVRVRVDAWRGGVLLAEDVPVFEGTWSEASDQTVQESLALTVPAVGPDGRQWIPTGRGSSSPLGCDGHRLRLTYTIPRGDGGRVESCVLGWVRVQNWQSLDRRTVELAGTGLLSILEGYRLLTATSPPAGAKLLSEVVRLVEGQLSVDVTEALGIDRFAPAAMAWTEDRLGALYELADALPAELRVDQYGTLRVVPTDPGSDYVPDVTLTEGFGGTVVSANVSESVSGTVITAGDGASRDGVANIVVARGEDSASPDRTPVSAVARDTNPLSPTNVAAYDPVVKFFSSPLLQTRAQCLAAARAILARSTTAASSIEVETLPDPRIRWGSRVELVRRNGRVHQTVALAVGLPLTAAGGPMTLTLGEVV